ncbi:phospholipase B1, membrane-associated isoform X2 [Austrofundulus limnaeus]|uniref:Phospholipase B1, membrane-associated n=1 Tax=Austrofundulus limnaeus TaxID=52670 RepID=A0A2I4C645_AUSLI|nr:PREDICTED: phospholipase B1, membrane-associated-like isoform X2 [Austrofundulus limnaeus]
MLQQLLLISLLGFTTGLLCPQMFPSQQPPSTADKVKPSDVAALSYIGLHEHCPELSTVLSKFRELLSVFSPGLLSPLPDRNINVPHFHGPLMEQANQVSLYLKNQDVDVTGWKLVLVFVQMDQFCPCEQQQQVLLLIRGVVKEVDDALKVLHSQLKHTVVSVALWDGEQDAFPRKTCPCVSTSSEGELRLQRATFTQLLQESLGDLMVQKHWYNDRDDFTVTLQDAPFIRDPSFVVTGKPLSESRISEHTDELMIQLWMNLMQPPVKQQKTEKHIFTLLCPDEDRPFLRTERNSPRSPGGEASPLDQAITGTEMPCEDLGPSASTPTSVHELRPGDIKVVAAVGDSLTAGNGIASSPNNILDVLQQYRGLSWSVGGDKNLTSVTTLPNILKHFNHNLTGYSVGTGNQDSPQAFLNQAVAGAKSRDVPSQVQTLVTRMKNDPRINFESDWKLITVFIGGNDVCDHCSNSLLYSVQNYAQNVRKSLDYLHKQVPRALVNVVEVLHITPLREMHSDESLKCPTWLVNILCPCVVLPKSNSDALQGLENINRGYQDVLHEIVESGRYDTRPDFTVVIQPFFREIVVPRLPDGRPDRSFFSADCFHLSQKAQTLMARSLWNNMLEPLGQKHFKLEFNVTTKLKCPTKDSPFIRTYNNSNYIYSGPSPTTAPVTNWGSDFSCKNFAPSDPQPSSVHKLRPSDIQVVAALGDSITAGTGAKSKNLLELKIDYKGVSWSIGADKTLETVTTLPNILKKFNPSLKGFSQGQGPLRKGFNMAAAGAKTSELPAQVRNLIKTMKENKEVDFEKDWKLVTILIGANDLCHFCLDQNNLSPKNYSENLMLSLDMLYKEVPRLLVNVVDIMQIDVLKTVRKNTLSCSLLQRTSCPCVISPAENSPEFEEIKQINHKYQAEMEFLVSGGRYDGKEDFAVVLQPFLHNSFIPRVGVGEVDTSFFSIDCFHMSERAHAEMAIALWNNMLEPVGRKQAYNNFTYDRSKIHCPSEASPFIFTKTNSLPAPPVTTTAPTDTTSDLPRCASTLPVWVPVVVGIVSFLAGVIVSWLILSCVQRRNNRKEAGRAEMKRTGF